MSLSISDEYLIRENKICAKIEICLKVKTVDVSSKMFECRTVMCNYALVLNSAY